MRNITHPLSLCLAVTLLAIPIGPVRAAEAPQVRLTVAEAVAVALREAAGHLLVTLAASPDITLHAHGVEKVGLNAGGGDDLITVQNLLGTGLQALAIDAGAGNDTLEASALTALGVSLTGGAGNDTLAGGKGDDTLVGNAGSDTFAWQTGDGQDTLEGGHGDDRLTVTGSDAADAFDLSAEAGRLRVAQTNPPGGGVRAMEVERVTLNARAGDDTVTVQFSRGRPSRR